MVIFTHLHPVGHGLLLPGPATFLTDHLNLCPASPFSFSLPDSYHPLDPATKASCTEGNLFALRVTLTCQLQSANRDGLHSMLVTDIGSMYSGGGGRSYVTVSVPGFGRTYWFLHPAHEKGQAALACPRLLSQHFLWA